MKMISFSFVQWSTGGMKFTGENRSTRGKPVPVPLCPPQSQQTEPGSNPGLSGEIPETHRMSHGTASWVLNLLCCRGQEWVGLYLPTSIRLDGVYRDNFTFTFSSYVTRRHYRSVTRNVLKAVTARHVFVQQIATCFWPCKTIQCLIASHERTNKEEKNARRLAWAVLLTPGDYVATSSCSKDRNIINTASSFCCGTANRLTATAEQVTVPSSVQIKSDLLYCRLD
jgi:hypothetical protein